MAPVRELPIREAFRLLASPKPPLCTNNSGNNEWYTPAEIIEAARQVMGSIDTDPASSALANETVMAGQFYTAEQDGLQQAWTGNVWLNPPYAQPLIAEFAAAMVEKFNSGEVVQACVLVNNATDTRWFAMLAERSSAVCFTRGRTRFIGPDGQRGESPLQGQAILYFGPNGREFADVFCQFGFVYIGTPTAAGIPFQVADATLLDARCAAA